MLKLSDPSWVTLLCISILLLTQCGIASKSTVNEILLLHSQKENLGKIIAMTSLANLSSHLPVLEVDWVEAIRSVGSIHSGSCLFRWAGLDSSFLGRVNYKQKRKLIYYYIFFTGIKKKNNTYMRSMNILLHSCHNTLYSYINAAVSCPSQLMFGCFESPWKPNCSPWPPSRLKVVLDSWPVA